MKHYIFDRMKSIRKRGSLAVAFVAMMFLCFACQNSSSSQEKEQDPMSEPIHDFVFDHSDDFAQCHASTVARMDNGEFIVAWFGGTAEKDDDVGIWMSKGKPGNWTEPIELEKLRDDPHWNPVLFTTPEGRVILYFKVGKEIPTWETWNHTSDRKSTRLNSSHVASSYADFCLKKKRETQPTSRIDIVSETPHTIRM